MKMMVHYEGMELRKLERIYFNKQITINDTIIVTAIDISTGGLYVHTPLTFKSGTIVELSLPFKDTAIKVKAKIKHVQTGVGMGLRFVDLDDVKIAQIKELIKISRRKPTKAKSDKPSVLFVEDNEMSRRMIKQKLTSEGFWVVEAKDGVEAINILAEERIDIILLDLYMDKMSGFKVLSILKSAPEWKDIPVVVYSAKGTDDIIDKVISAGADGFLVKMITSPAKIAEALKAQLARHEDEKHD
jgi:CheY-like chemotaxis protein